MQIVGVTGFTMKIVGATGLFPRSQRSYGLFEISAFIRTTDMARSTRTDGHG